MKVTKFKILALKNHLYPEDEVERGGSVCYHGGWRKAAVSRVCLLSDRVHTHVPNADSECTDMQSWGSRRRGFFCVLKIALVLILCLSLGF